MGGMVRNGQGSVVSEPSRLPLWIVEFESIEGCCGHSSIVEIHVNAVSLGQAVEMVHQKYTMQIRRILKAGRAQ
jgi:hypothetical protein